MSRTGGTKGERKEEKSPPRGQISIRSIWKEFGQKKRRKKSPDGTYNPKQQVGALQKKASTTGKYLDLS